MNSKNTLSVTYGTRLCHSLLSPSSQPSAASFDRWGHWSAEKFKHLMEAPPWERSRSRTQIQDLALHTCRWNPWTAKVGHSLLCESPGVCKWRGRVLSETRDATVEFLEAKSLLVHSYDRGGGGTDRNCWVRCPLQLQCAAALATWAWAPWISSLLDYEKVS